MPSVTPRALVQRSYIMQLKKAQSEAADTTTKLDAVESALKTLEGGDLDNIKRQYVDAVRKTAVVQVMLHFAATCMSGHVNILCKRLARCSHMCNGR